MDFDERKKNDWLLFSKWCATIHNWCLFVSYTVDDVVWKWAVGNGQWEVYSTIDGVRFGLNSNWTTACVPILIVIKFTIYIFEPQIWKRDESWNERFQIIINKPLKYSNFHSARKNKVLMNISKWMWKLSNFRWIPKFRNAIDLAGLTFLFSFIVNE